MMYSYSIKAELKDSSIKLKGDIRYRNERMSSGTGSSKTTLNRDRIRARIKASGSVNDQIKAIIGLATGSTGTSSITSTNQTLEGGGSKKSITLDLAYIDWSIYNGIGLSAGKMKNYIFSPVNSDLIFDNDYTPEGFSIYGAHQFELVDFNYIFSRHWINFKEDTANIILNAPQISLSYKGPVFIKFGGGFLKYSSIKNETVIVDKGNSLSAQNKYLMGFSILQMFTELEYTSGDYMVKFFYEFAHNKDAIKVSPSKKFENNAYLLGTQLSFKKLSLIYDYRSIEKNSILGGFGEGDSCGGVTTCRGHRLKLKYGITQNTHISAVYYDMKNTNSKSHYNKIHTDFEFKF